MRPVVIVLLSALLVAAEPHASPSEARGHRQCVDGWVPADTEPLRLPSGKTVGHIRLAYRTGVPQPGFCGTIHVKRRFREGAQVRYTLDATYTDGSDAPGGTASEPARHPHMVGNMCSCYATGSTGTYTVTWIGNFYGDGPKRRVTAVATATLP